MFRESGGDSMPIYEYRCTRCGHQFDVTHAVGQAVEECEVCKGPVRRVFSPVGIIFKGPGFHVNDYRKSSASSEGNGKADAEKSSREGSSGESSSTGDKAAADGKHTTADSSSKGDIKREGAASSSKTNKTKGSESSAKASAGASKKS
jgi:putative FmdB family regulatory protein